MAAEKPSEKTRGSFYPLTEGSFWKYRSEVAKGGPPKTSVYELRVLTPAEMPESMPSFEGVSDLITVRRNEEDNPSFNEMVYFHYALEDGWVVELGWTMVSDSEYGGNGSCSYLPPRRKFPIDPNPPQTWTWEGIECINGRQYKTTRSCELQGNCAEETIVFRCKELSEDQTYKRGIGLVSESSDYNDGSLGGWGWSKLELLDSDVK